MIRRCNIDILTNLSYISKVVEFSLNYFVDMKDIITVLSKMTPILGALFIGLMISFPMLIEGSRGCSLNLE